MEDNENHNQNLAEPSQEELDAIPEDQAVAEAGENADPSMAVDGMLDAALQQGEHTEPLVEEESENTVLTDYAPEFPVYSIFIKSITVQEKELLQKALEKNSFGCSLEDIQQQLATNRLHLSQLSELQMIALAHELHRYSIPFFAHKYWDENSPQTDWQNLQNSSDTQAEITTEGAASVNLLPGTSEVLLASSKEIPGFMVQQNFGLVLAHKSIARKFFRNLEQEELLEKELRKIKKERTLRSLLPYSGMEKCFRSLFSDLQKAALSLGANAVLDVKIETFPESSSSLDPDLDQMRIVLSGTASVLEKTAL